jgi:hypothetical protein
MGGARRQTRSCAIPEGVAGRDIEPLGEVLVGKTPGRSHLVRGIGPATIVDTRT